MKLPGWSVGAGLVVLAMLFLWWVGHEAEVRGRLQAENRALKAHNAALADSVRVVDTVYHTDTLVFHQKARSYNKARAIVVVHPTDTAAVTTFIATADSTIRACSNALLTCEDRVAIRDHRIGVLDSLWHVEHSLRRGKRFLGIPVGCAAGGAVTPKGFGPGVTCGVRF